MFAITFYSINRNKAMIFIQLSMSAKWYLFVKTCCSFSRQLKQVVKRDRSDDECAPAKNPTCN